LNSNTGTPEWRLARLSNWAAKELDHNPWGPKAFEETIIERVAEMKKAIIDANIAYELSYLLAESEEYEGASYPRDMLESHLNGLLSAAGMDVNARTYHKDIVLEARKWFKEIMGYESKTPDFHGESLKKIDND